MKLSATIVGVCVGSWALCILVLPPRAAAAALLGMAAPLALGLATRLLVRQTARSDMRRLTARLTWAFIVKMVFYAVYVSVVIGVLGFDATPFAVSFTGYFLALQLTEALHLRTLAAKTAID